MYGCWTLVYVPALIFEWIKKGVFGWEQILKWLHMAAVIQTYATIWFLPALAIGIAIVYFLLSKLDKKTMLALCVVLYVFGALGHTYHFLVDHTIIGKFFDAYLLIFKTSRNGLFNAVPFVYMGALLSDKEIASTPRPQMKYTALTVIHLLLIAAESFFLKKSITVCVTL